MNYTTVIITDNNIPQIMPWLYIPSPHGPKDMKGIFSWKIVKYEESKSIDNLAHDEQFAWD